jgi:hypothetical protein
MKTNNIYFPFLIILLAALLSACKEDEVLKQIAPPRPQVAFTFTDAQGNPTRISAPNFTIGNPGLNGSFTFNVQINPNDNRLVDSIFVEYQYGLLTSGGGSSTFGWELWDVIDVTTADPVYTLTYTFNIADLNENYIGAPWLTSGKIGNTIIARDENETRITVKFTDGSTARSPKMTWTYPNTPQFRE